MPVQVAGLAGFIDQGGCRGSDGGDGQADRGRQAALPCDNDRRNRGAIGGEGLACIVGGSGRIDVDPEGAQDGEQGVRRGDAEASARVAVGGADARVGGESVECEKRIAHAAGRVSRRAEPARSGSAVRPLPQHSPAFVCNPYTDSSR